MSSAAEAEGQMDGGCRAAPRQREPPRAAITQALRRTGKLGGETQSVMLDTLCLTRPLPWNPGASHSIANEHV